jgi:endo-1,4-beta-xylanase
MSRDTGPKGAPHPAPVPSRREVLGGAVAGVLAAAAPASADTRRVPFGAAVMIQDFRADPQLRADILRWCDVWVPMNDLKWDALRPSRDRFAFADADESLAFARSHGLATRGHALLWGEALPDWVRRITGPAETARLLEEHIERVMDHFRGRVPSWDVVNEVIAHDPTPSRPWRETHWHRQLGPRLLDIAFAAAHRADPKAELVLNDYDFENDDERTAERRRACLAMVRHLQDRRIPVHAVGLQGHLYGSRTINRRALTAFCRELGRLGIKVTVTELDVTDWKLSPDPATRDAEAAGLVRAFLESILEGQRPQSVVCWGLTDRSSWISEVFPRADRLPNRPLPLDRQSRPKPMMDVIQALLRPA